MENLYLKNTITDREWNSIKYSINPREVKKGGERENTGHKIDGIQRNQVAAC